MATARRGERGPLRIAIEDFIKTYDVPPELRGKWRGFLSGVEGDLAGYMTTTLVQLGIPSRDAQNLVGRLARVQGAESLGTFLALFVMVIVGIFGAASAFSEPYVRFASYVGNTAVPNQRLAVQEILRAHWRGVLTPGQTWDDLKAYGHTNENAARLDAIYRPRLTENELVQALWRGTKSDGEFTAELLRKGWTPDDAASWREFANSIPGISDTIRFLVRDVYRDDVVRHYGYDEGWPVGRVIELGAKQGYSAEIMQAFWRAHWQLPSPTQAADMVHRAGLSLNDYDELLRVADYPPFWREYFKRLIFHPLTRVDIRRVQRVLKKDRVWLIARHKEIGYNDENAATLADFILADQQEKDKDLTKADIAAAYEDRAISRDQAVAQLGVIGYDANEADVILRRVDIKLREEAIREEVELIHQRFLAELFTEQQARSGLAGLGQSQVRIEALILRWKRENEVKPRLPTRADAETFAKKGVITLVEYDEYLAALGYPAKYRDWYIREVTGQKAV